MKMSRKYVVRRRVSAVILALVVTIVFTYATRDICYVGNSGNALGYGSCEKMINEVITNG